MSLKCPAQMHIENAWLVAFIGSRIDQPQPESGGKSAIQEAPTEMQPGDIMQFPRSAFCCKTRELYLVIGFFFPAL